MNVMMRHWFATLGFAALFTQCSASTPDAPPPPKFPDADAFCTGWAQAECSDTVIQVCLAPGKGACLAARQTKCTAVIVSPETQLGHTYDNTKAEGCVNAVAAAYADARLTSEEQAAIDTACALVFSGTVARNSACTVDADCKQADGLKCVVHAAPLAEGGASASGTCQVPVSATAGQPCSAVDAVCVDGFHCGTTSHCDANGAANEACSQGVPCATGLKCGSANVCEPKIADGNACTKGSECAHGICAEGANLCASIMQLSSAEQFCIAARPAGDQ
jgi:hypothetical protein